MNRRRFRNASAALAAIALMLPARPAGAAVLLGVRAVVVSANDARVALTFDRGTPNFRIYGNGTNDVTVVLVRTTIAANTASTISGKDALRSVTLEPIGDSVNVTFHESRPATLSVAVGGGQSLIATLTPAAPAATPAPIAVPAAPTPAPAIDTGTEIEVVRLKYADVSEIVGLLVPGQQIASNDSFTPQEQNFGSSGLSGGYGGIGGLGGLGGVGGLGSPAQSIASLAASSNAASQSLGQQISEAVGVDRRLNAIVLTGTPAVIARLKDKIAKLDVPLASVVLETQVVELTDTAARDVGIDFTNAGGPVITATTEIKSLTTATHQANLQAAIYAQVSQGRGRVIARPQIVAQSGGSANIITGDALPIVTSIAVSGVNALSQQVQYVNVGVSLQISPRISTDGFVTSHVFSEVSSVTGYQQGYPTLSQREATTVATVRDGESFVIGGLLQQNDISNLAKVPGIGDLPLIGGLFRVRRETHQSTNLYIIVTPRILTNGNPVPPGVGR